MTSRRILLAGLSFATLLPAWTTGLPAQANASLAYQAPAGWTESVNPASGLVSLVPPGLPYGRVCVLNVFSPERFAGTNRDYHDEVVRRVTHHGVQLEPPRHGTAGAFIVTTLHQRAANGVQLWITIYTTRWSDQGQVFIFTANATDVAVAYFPSADAMIRGISVPQAASALSPADTPSTCLRPTGTEFCPAPIPAGDRDVPITGAYIATTAETGFKVGSGVASRVGTTVLLLFANGVAVRTAAMKDGSIDDTYWAEGFATMDPTDSSQIGMRRLGRWSEAAGHVTIAWRIGAPVSLTRDGEKLMDGHATWAPYHRVDGLRFEGRYAHVVEFGPPWSVTLHKDGTFSSDGLNEIMGGTMVNPGFPVHGSGTYQITKWSLVLRFSTGFLQSINLMLGQGDPADPADIVLNGTDFARAAGR
jgi:hypothetical protein